MKMHLSGIGRVTRNCLLIILISNLAVSVHAQTVESTGALSAEIGETRRDLLRIHTAILPELGHLVRVQIKVSPELAMTKEPIKLSIEALAHRKPNETLDLYPDYIAQEMALKQNLKLEWKKTGSRFGLDVYQATLTLKPDRPGSYLVHWACDIGGDVPDFWRPFAVIDKSYAVCLFNSTSHRPPLPDEDFHRLHLPFEKWEHDALMLPERIGQPAAEHWAAISREYRQYGHKPTPMLFADYYRRIRSPGSRFNEEAAEIQKAVLSLYREVWPFWGFAEPMDNFAAYSIGNRPIQIARALGYRQISALCAGQNWQDGNFRINQSGMPERPYFIGTDDFRKASTGGPEGIVGINQCQRNVLNHDYGCTFVLEPAWNIFDGGAGRAITDDLSLSRQYDFFEAMLQNRLSQNTPYYFSVGIEFNGVLPGITEANRLFIKYAAEKAKTTPLVFSTGTAVTDFFRRHYRKSPETTCYQQDFFAGMTKYEKPASYPDMLEIEGPDFKSIFKAHEILPYYHYDYQEKWNYPDWGNEQLPRNKSGYLAPDTYDRFQATPRIVDTRKFLVVREDSTTKDKLVITVKVRAVSEQRNMALALWDIPREWSPQRGWWSVSGDARFLPVRAPYTGNLNGILVANIAPGENRFTVVIRRPARELQVTGIVLDNAIEGRVYLRDGKLMAYLWPLQPSGATLVMDLPGGKSAEVYVAPDGKGQPFSTGRHSVELGPQGWMRLVGLNDREIRQYCSARKVSVSSDVDQPAAKEPGAKEKVQ